MINRTKLSPRLKPGTPLSIASGDALANSLRRISALAELLSRSSSTVANDHFEPATVNETASIIAEEAARMRAVLDTVSDPATRRLRSVRQGTGA